MTYDQERILEDHELDRLAHDVVAADINTARRQYGRAVIEATLLRVRGRVPASDLDPVLIQAQTAALNVVGADMTRRNAFEAGVRWLLDSGLVTEKE